MRIDNKKAFAIKNWLEKTCDNVLALVEGTQHDVPFANGPFGEGLSELPYLFLGSFSPISVAASASCGLEPMEKP